MNVAGLLFLLLVHYITGRGLLACFRTDMGPVRNFCLSMIFGVGLASVIPFVMELFHLDLTALSVGIALAVPAVVIGAVFFRRLLLWRPRKVRFRLPQMYELPFIAVFLFLAFLSVWRCYYNPPFAWDMLSGPEGMAEFAVREKHMINSFFLVDLQYTNNYLKSPYIISLQVVYKLLVQEFGQLWLSVLFVSFTGFLFTLLRPRLHPVVGYLVMLVYFAAPELFSYGYIILYDYSNMIFYFLGVYFLSRFFEEATNGTFLCALLAFGLATYIRSETLVLVMLMIPLLVYRLYRRHAGWKSLLLKTGFFALSPVVMYLLVMEVYVRFYIPVSFDVGTQLNTHLADVSVLFTRYYDIFTVLLYGPQAPSFYGLLTFFFTAVLLIDLIFYRRFSIGAQTAIYGILVVYIGLGLVGYLLPLADLLHTTKRGLLRIFPLMLLYLANSCSLQHLSAIISHWESGKPMPKKDSTPDITKPTGIPAANPTGRANKPEH